MTDGLSPKIIPAILVALAGVIVAVIGALNHDNATLGVGVSLLSAGGVAAGGGFLASPGEVVQHTGAASDELLDVGLEAKLRAVDTDGGATPDEEPPPAAPRRTPRR